MILIDERPPHVAVTVDGYLIRITAIVPTHVDVTYTAPIATAYIESPPLRIIIQYLNKVYNPKTKNIFEKSS